MSSALIGIEELRSAAGVRVVDASWHMPSSGRDAGAEYRAAHIPGAMFFDLDAVSDHSSPYPHMVPSQERFAQAMEALGIGNDTDVVVYDTAGIFSAPRLWWMLRLFGHTRVRVLNGGLPAWQQAGYVLEAGEVMASSGVSFVPHFRPELLATQEQVGQWSARGAVQLCDARSPARFSGAEPEPRPGLKSGHIPGARNVHYAALLREGALLPAVGMADIFVRAGIDIAAPLAVSCGSGVTACILALALYELGRRDVPVYDGSWAQWGMLPLPIATGL